MRRAVLALALLASTAARADDLVEARREMAALHFARALTLLDARLRAGGHSPSETAEIHRLLGMSAGALEQSDEALRHFRRLLALDPGAALEEGTSPKITRPFEKARQGGAAVLRVRADAVKGRRAIAVVVESDPERMVAGARLALPSGPLDVKVSGTIVVPVEGTEAARVQVAVVDAWGNTLAELAPVLLDEAPAPERPAPVVVEREREVAPLWARWPPWAAGAAVALAVGTVYGLEARSTQKDLDELNAHSSEHDIAEAIALRDEGRRQARIANIAFAAGGALGIVAGILLVRELAFDDGPTVGAAITPGGAALTVESRF